MKLYRKSSLCRHMKKKRIKENLCKYILKFMYEVFLVALIPIITILYNRFSSDMELKKNINNISIGQNLEYCNQSIGIPCFQYYHNEDDIEEKVYDNKYSVIRVFFKEESIVGFFVTAKEKGSNIRMPRQFERFLGNKPLGEISFFDIEQIPEDVSSYTQNGTGHVFYCEKYYYASSGNYYSFYFGFLDYGFVDCKYSRKDFYNDEEIKQIYKLDDLSFAFLLNRKKSMPNTYGIVCGGYENISEYFSDYRNFDFRSLF